MGLPSTRRDVMPCSKNILNNWSKVLSHCLKGWNGVYQICLIIWIYELFFIGALAPQEPLEQTNGPSSQKSKESERFRQMFYKNENTLLIQGNVTQSVTCCHWLEGL